MTTLGARINGRQLERRPIVVSPATVRRAVEIAAGIENQAGLGRSPVRAVASSPCGATGNDYPIGRAHADAGRRKTGKLASGRAQATKVD